MGIAEPNRMSAGIRHRVPNVLTKRKKAEDGCSRLHNRFQPTCVKAEMRIRMMAVRVKATFFELWNQEGILS